MNPFTTAATDAPALTRDFANDLTAATGWNDDTRRKFDQRYTNEIALQLDLLVAEVRSVETDAWEVLRLLE